MPGNEDGLSAWGWGLADRFPSADERAGVAAMLEQMLGFPELGVQEPVDLAKVDVAEARVDPPGDLAASADPETRLTHAYGKAFPDLLRGFHGTFEHVPDLVARPSSEQAVVDLLAWAAEAQVAVVPFGGGTSVVGGVEADVGERFSGVLSLDLQEMDEVLAVDEASRLARIQAGALGPRINEQLAEHDLCLRHYPQSYEFSTLGGWLATRAGGHYATVYTHIDDLCHTLRLVTPTGAMEPRGVPASGAGPDPKRLILGSEGALGVITEAWMRVVPRPRYKAKAEIRFDQWPVAVQAVRRIVQAGLAPTQCRLLDGTQAMLDQVTLDGSSVLVVGFEGTEQPVDQRLEQAVELATRDAGEVSKRSTGDREDEEGASGYRSAFLQAPYLFNVLVSLGVVVDTFETAVTWDRFEQLDQAVRANVMDAMEDACGMGVLACRFTHVYPDGPAPYYTFLAPGERGDELAQWRRIKETASETLMENGATITHHHAVGRTHKPWYHEEAPERFLDALRAVKAEVDPAGIMNPGVLL